MILPSSRHVLNLVSQHGYAYDVYLVHVYDYALTSYAHEHDHAAVCYPTVHACADDAHHVHGGVHDTM